jgi:NAD(P)H-flavin reductase
MWVETVTRVIEPTHPFTVASLSSDDHIKLVVRASKLPLFDGNYFIVSGPYASQASLDFPNMRSRKTLVIAGGSGISLGAPIARSCLERGEQVRLLWVTRERSDIRLLKLLDIESAVVYITGSSTGSTDYSDTMGSRISKTEADVGGDVFEVDELLHKHDLDDDNYTIGDDSDEEDDTPTSTASDSKTSRASTPPPLDSAAASSGAGPFHNREEGLDIRDGRPVISQESLSFFGSSGGPETLVVACGPVKLVSDAKRWARANSVQFTGDVYQV